MKFVLIFFLATPGDFRAGVGSIETEFSTKAKCELAGNALAQNVFQSKKGQVITWGCFEK